MKENSFAARQRGEWATRRENQKSSVENNSAAFSRRRFPASVLIWLILCLIWGTTWFFIKIGLEDLPPISFAAARFTLAVLILGIVIFFQKIPLPQTKRDWKLLALTGVLQFSINYSLVFWSEQYISSGLAAVLQAMISVFGLVLAWIHLPNEKITWIKIMSVALGICGVAVVFIEQLQIKSWLAFVGCVAIVGGAYAAAHASILVKAFGGNLHPASLVFGQMICGILPIIIYASVVEGNPLALHWTWKALISVLYLTIFGTVAAFWLYYLLLSKIESNKAMMISLVTPLIAVIIGNLFLGERLPLQTFLGGALILASIGLIVFKAKGNLKPQTNTDEHRLENDEMTNNQPLTSEH